MMTDAIVSIVDTRLRLPIETLERNAGRNATLTLLRMVGSGLPPDVRGPRHFLPGPPNNFEALVKFEFPLQR